MVERVNTESGFAVQTLFSLICLHNESRNIIIHQFIMHILIMNKIYFFVE